MSEEKNTEWMEEEIRRCKESPAYYYNNYFTKGNALELTDMDFENLKWNLLASRLKLRSPVLIETLKSWYNNQLPDFL